MMKNKSGSHAKNIKQITAGNKKNQAWNRNDGEKRKIEVQKELFHLINDSLCSILMVYSLFAGIALHGAGRRWRTS
jgi:hypothetical protein